MVFGFWIKLIHIFSLVTDLVEYMIHIIKYKENLMKIYDPTIYYKNNFYQLFKKKYCVN